MRLSELSASERLFERVHGGDGLVGSEHALEDLRARQGAGGHVCSSSTTGSCAAASAGSARGAAAASHARKNTAVL